MPVWNKGCIMNREKDTKHNQLVTKWLYTLFFCFCSKSSSHS